MRCTRSVSYTSKSYYIEGAVDVPSVSTDYRKKGDETSHLLSTVNIDRYPKVKSMTPLEKIAKCLEIYKEMSELGIDCTEWFSGDARLTEVYECVIVNKCPIKVYASEIGLSVQMVKNLLTSRKPSVYSKMMYWYPRVMNKL